MSELDIATRVALIGTSVVSAAYLVYRWRSSHFAANLTTTLSIDRTRYNEAHDWMTIHCTVVKGDRGSVRMECLHCRVSTVNERSELGAELLRGRFYGSHRVLVDAHLACDTLQFDTVDPENPLLRLPPGEQATFAYGGVVPRSEACAAEVVLVGELAMPDVWPYRLQSHVRGQWRASGVVAPLST